MLVYRSGLPRTTVQMCVSVTSSEVTRIEPPLLCHAACTILLTPGPPCLHWRVRVLIYISAALAISIVVMALVSCVCVYAGESRATILGSLQPVVEIHEFLALIRKAAQTTSAGGRGTSELLSSALACLNMWNGRFPSVESGDLKSWDDVVYGRDLFTSRLQDMFASKGVCL